MAGCARPGDAGCHRDQGGLGRRGARVNAVIQAYRFALDPTPEQDVVLRSHCGGQRFAFNWGPALVTAVVDQREAEASYGIPGAEPAPAAAWAAKSKEAYSSGLANLVTALGNYASRSGKRRGPKVRFPRFKGKQKTLS